MKVLLGHNFYKSSAPSGEDNVFRNERQLLINNNIEVFSYEKFNDDIDDSNISKRISVALDYAWSKSTYDEICNIISLFKPDIAHFHSIFPQISTSAYKACKDNNVPVVQTLHNFRFICPGALLMRNSRPCEDCVGSSILPSLIHRCYRNSLAATAAISWQITRNRWSDAFNTLVDQYIVLTNFAATKFINAGYLPHKISIKPNFLPHSKYIKKNAVKPYAVFVGRLSAEKGLKTLVNAWLNIDNLSLKIVGDGDLRTELEIFCIKHQLDIEFLGLQSNNDVLDLVGNAMLQIIPSEWYEGFPMVVLEAYGLGIPIVASRIGGLAEIVLDNTTGFLFEPGNSKDLAAKVISLKNDPALQEIMSINANNIFYEKYTPDINFSALSLIYENTIANYKYS